MLPIGGCFFTITLSARLVRLTHWVAGAGIAAVGIGFGLAGAWPSAIACVLAGLVRGEVPL